MKSLKSVDLPKKMVLFSLCKMNLGWNVTWTCSWQVWWHPLCVFLQHSSCMCFTVLMKTANELHSSKSYPPSTSTVGTGQDIKIHILAYELKLHTAKHVNAMNETSSHRLFSFVFPQNINTCHDIVPNSMKAKEA